MQLNRSKEHKSRECKTCFYMRQVVGCEEVHVTVMRTLILFYSYMDRSCIIFSCRYWYGLTNSAHQLFLTSYSKACQMSVDLYEITFPWFSYDGISDAVVKFTAMRHRKNLVRVNGKKIFEFLDARIQRPRLIRTSQRFSAQWERKEYFPRAFVTRRNHRRRNRTRPIGKDVPEDRVQCRKKGSGAFGGYEWRIVKQKCGDEQLNPKLFIYNTIKMCFLCQVMLESESSLLNGEWRQSLVQLCPSESPVCRAWCLVMVIQGESH